VLLVTTMDAAAPPRRAAELYDQACDPEVERACVFLGGPVGRPGERPSQPPTGLRAR
jgi:hypothetical protein